MVGKTIAHYQVLEKLGEGGMGIVWKARDTQLDRDVALKVLPADALTDSAARTRLLREARTASQLNHPHICTIYEVGESDGLVFIAMELVEGQTLSARLEAGALPVEEVLRFGLQLADALAHAHKRGIIHRDLKSANVVITTEGRAKVLDFGLAKRLRGEPGGDATTLTQDTVTAPGAVAGTPAYMAPEQFRGQPADARSDIWALGVMLYEMASGARPFRGTTAFELSSAILNQPFPPLPPGPGGAPPAWLRSVIERCLEKDPARRYQTSDEVRANLETVQAGVTLKVWLAWKYGLSRRRWLAAALVLVVAVCVTVAVRWALRKSSEWTGPYTAVPLTTFPGRQVTPSISPDGKQVAFAWNGEKEDNYDIYVMQIATGSVLRLTHDPALEFVPAWSPDGNYIAFARASNTANVGVFVVPALGGVPRQVGEGGFAWKGREVPVDFATQIAWTPDSQSLVVSDRAGPGDPVIHLFLISTVSGEKRPLTSPPAEYVGDYSPSVSRSGKRIAFIRRHSSVEGHVYYQELTKDLRPSGEPVRLTTGAIYPDSPVWGAGDNALVFSSGPYQGLRNLWRISLSGNRQPVRLSSIGEDSYAVSVSPLHRRLVYSRSMEDSNIYRLPLDVDGSTAGPPVRLIASTRQDTRPRYSPDGRRICFVSNRTGTRELWISNSDGSDAVQRTNLGGLVVSTARWSPDGRWLSFALHHEQGADIYVMPSDTGQPRRLTQTAYAEGPGWSRDGKWIYFPSKRSGDLRVWRIRPEGGEPEPMAQKSTGAGGLAVAMGPTESADGKWGYYIGDDAWIWKAPVSGGAETRIAGPVIHSGTFAVNDRGIYFITPARPGEPAAIRLFDFASAQVRRLMTLTKPPRPGLDVSPDGKWLVYSQTDHVGSGLMLVENFP